MVSDSARTGCIKHCCLRWPSYAVLLRLTTAGLKEAIHTEVGRPFHTVDPLSFLSMLRVNEVATVAKSKKKKPANWPLIDLNNRPSNEPSLDPRNASHALNYMPIENIFYLHRHP